MNYNSMDAQTTIDESSRPLKRPRFYRKHPDSLQDDQAALAETPASSNSTPNPPSIDHTPAEPSIRPLETVDDDDHPSLSVADLLRRRRATQRKRAGIEFTNAPAVQESGAVESLAGDGPLEKEASLDKILTVVDRFAPQTGQVADVDKHMYAVTNDAILPKRDMY